MTEIGGALAKKLTPRTVLAPIEKADLLSEVFHENTKLGPLTGLSYYRHILTITRSASLRRLLSSPGKVFSLRDSIELKRPCPANAVEQSIVTRRSRRRFADQPLTLDTLSRLLHFSYGITDSKHRLRAGPSGGALYPLELYVIARRIEGLSHGIYHYSPDTHTLDAVIRADLWERVQGEVGFQYIDVERAAALIIICACFKRTTLKYRDRGYRMVLFEAGAAAQNLALVGEAISVSCCLLGGFHDDNLARLLGANGVDEAPLIPIVIGASTGRHEGRAGESDW